MFDILYHADWSVDPGKRWAAVARREGGGWRVDGPGPVPDAGAFCRTLLEEAGRASVLAGFDFPIGLPAAYGASTGFPNFRSALLTVGSEPDWGRFFCVADTPDQISVRRPFYPRSALKGASRRSLAEGLGVDGFDDLLRECERGSGGRRTACALFWTLGGNQVGRAAIAGWKEIVRPGLAAGARLWPFDGRLGELGRAAGLVLAETYPADSYAVFGGTFRARESKRRQPDRRAKADALLAWAAGARIDVGTARNAIVDGFGRSRAGEDAFDALAGLLKMISVVDGGRPEATLSLSSKALTWEGWIMGR